jgi:hypothetical protein
MKTVKKNNLILIDYIQSASYVLKLTSKSNLPVNAVQKKEFKQMINQELAAMKREIRKLKRV